MRFLLAAALFLFTVAVFTFAAKVVYQGILETELRDASMAALERAGLSGVEVTYDHHEAIIRGTVEDAAEKAEVLKVLREAVPLAGLPTVEGLMLSIRPTLPPEIVIRREAESAGVVVEGRLGTDREFVQGLLTGRLQTLEGVKLGDVDMRLRDDPMRLPVNGAAELVSVVAELIRYSHRSGALIRLESGSLELRGTVPNGGIKESLLELAATLNPADLVDEIEVSLPDRFLKPATFAMTRNRFGITFSGVVGSEETVGKLVSAVMDGRETLRVTDRIQVDESVSPGYWEEHQGELLPLLLEKFEGEMSVDFGPRQIRVQGDVSGEEARHEILQAFAPIQKNFGELTLQAEIREIRGGEGDAPHSSAELVISYEENLLSLEGTVTDGSLAKTLEKSLASEFPDLLVKATLETDGERRGARWEGRLAAFLGEVLPRVERAVFSFSDGTLKMEGKTLSSSDRLIIRNVAVNTVGSDTAIKNLLAHEEDSFPQPKLLPEERERIAEALKEIPIYFALNSEIVDAEGREKAGRIVEIMTEAEPMPHFRVTGFADNVGNLEYNRQLSLRRAESVSEFLQSLGVTEEKVEVLSETVDVSGIPTRERWKARRVEVTLAPPSEDPKPE